MEKTKSSRFQKFIKLIESLCNKIPQPGILFMYLFVITAVLSLILSKFNVLVINPTTNSELYVKNFFSVDGLYWFLGKIISNFTSFPPLGLVLVMTAAVGLCEESGLIVTLLNEKMKHIFPALLPYVVAFVGILGNIASDTAVIVIPSLAGLLYLAAGKHPVAGMICGYAARKAGLNAADFTGYGLIIAFILFSSIINFFIPSASAKWAILAPVFIPMMILAGEYHPAMTQLFYRLGDSMSNCITPFSPYIWVTLKAAQDFYDPKLKLGTLISNMIPIGIVISVVCIVFLIVGW